MVSLNILSLLSAWFSICFQYVAVNVLHIAQTSIYDSAATPSDAITIMSDTYSSGSWHYTNSDGKVPDLHHLIMYKNLGGG